MMSDKKFNLKKILIVVSIPLLIILVSIYFYIKNSRYIDTDDAYIKIGMAQISPQISGVVAGINVQNNQKIKKDDVIFTIDSKDYQITLESAKADLAKSINQINALKSSYYSEIASLEAAKVDLAYLKKQYNRIRDLKSKNAVSQADYDAAKKEFDMAVQNVKNIEESMAAQLAELDGNIDLPVEQYSIYLQAKAAVDKAEYDLSNTVIKAPFDGEISNFYLKPGSYVTAGVPLFSLVDYKDIWIEANYKETQLTDIRKGQKARVEIDSFPGKALNAKVDSITKATGSEFSILPAQNSSGNWVKVSQRIMVKFILSEIDENLPLSSGMSTIVTIDTKSK